MTHLLGLGYIGGRLPTTAKALSNESYRELLYRFEFPERPGALMAFVNNLNPEWSISIFHYRNHGADIGRIVVGVLVKENEISDLLNNIANASGFILETNLKC